MVKKNEKSKGFIAIISLLIISTISIIFAMSILKSGINNASLSLSSIFYENARINANTCVEDVLHRIKQEDQFNRNLNYTITDEDYCSTNITWYTPQQINPHTVETLVNLEVSGVSKNFIRNYIYELRIYRYNVNYLDGSLDYINTIDIISIDEQTT